MYFQFISWRVVPTYPATSKRLSKLSLYPTDWYFYFFTLLHYLEMKLLCNTQDAISVLSYHLSGHRLEFAQPGGQQASLCEIPAHGQASHFLFICGFCCSGNLQNTNCPHVVFQNLRAELLCVSDKINLASEGSLINMAWISLSTVGLLETLNSAQEFMNSESPMVSEQWFSPKSCQDAAVEAPRSQFLAGLCYPACRSYRSGW